MMSISENIWKNLLQRAYNYVDSGYDEWGLWKTQMESFLHTSNNELMEFFSIMVSRERRHDFD